MKKVIKLMFLSSVIIFLLFVIPNDQSETHEKDREVYEQFLREFSYSDDKNDSMQITQKNKGGYDERSGPALRAEQEFLMTMDPKLKTVPKERLLPVFETTGKLKRRLKGVSIKWTEHGPNNVGGRTRAVMFDPNDSEGKKFWAGGVTGGLWFTDDIIDSDPSWSKIDDFWDNIAVSCIAYDPVNPQIFYVGTGEIYAGVYAGSTRGFGIWKTTDAGVTWTRLTSTEKFYWVNDIVVRNESGAAVVYAAIGNAYYQGKFHMGGEGLYRSTDGGNNWTQVLPTAPCEGYSCPYQPSDIEIDASNNIWIGTRKNAYGYGGGTILQSSDGTTWSTVYTTDDANRMELACAPSNANVVYAVGEGGSGNDDIGIFEKSTDGGSNWSSVTIPLNENDNHFTRGQAWYDLILSVAPDNENILYAGGIDLHKTADGGSSWTMVSHWEPNFANYYGFEYVHADQHSFAFRPGYSNTVVFGNDGGIHMSTNAGADFTAKNSGYNVTQFYSVAVHPTDNYYLGGTQDNGTQQFVNATGVVSTTEPTGGDGAYCFIDQTDPSYQITSYTHNNYYISSDGGSNFTALPDDETGRFINPADYDDNADILYSAANADSIRRIHDVSGSYSSDYMNVTLGGGMASHIRASDYSTNVIYVGTSSGRLYKISNANSSGPSSVEITGSNFPTSWISCVELGGSDNDILVTFSNYGIKSVWETKNGGATWENKEGNLPDMPVRWALYNPNNRNEVFLATEVGIWRTESFDSSSPTWMPSNSGLANVRVDMLQIRESDYLVVAATHGRGFFSTSAFSSGIRITLSDITGSEDENTIVTLNATGSVTNAITFTASTDTTAVSASIVDTILTLTPIPNWHGLANVTVYAADGNSTDSTSFKLTVAPVNDAPTAFEWVSSALDTINITRSNLTDTYTLQWGTSTDAADGDSINYLVYAKIGVYPAEEIYDTTVTTLSRTYQEILDNVFEGSPVNAATVKYSVSATDGTDTVKVTGDDRVVFVNRYEYLSTVSEGIPLEFALHENYPNPFNPTTTLRFDLPDISDVTLTIYNMLGQRVKTFNMNDTPAGYHSIKWNATNDYGDPVGAGVYLYQLRTNQYVKTRKMVLLK